MQDQQIQQQKPMQIKVGNLDQIAQIQPLDELPEIGSEYDTIELNLSGEKEKNQTNIEILVNYIEYNATRYRDEIIYSKCRKLKINDYKIEYKGAKALIALKRLQTLFTLTLENCDIDLADFMELLLSNLNLNIINTSIEFDGESIVLTEEIARQKSAELSALSTDGKILDIKTKILTEKLKKSKEMLRLTDEKLEKSYEELKQKHMPKSKNLDEIKENESDIYQNSAIEQNQNNEIQILGEDPQ